MYYEPRGVTTHTRDAPNFPRLSSRLTKTFCDRGKCCSGEPARADSILNRVEHNARRIEMRGNSMPKIRGEARRMAHRRDHVILVRAGRTGLIAHTMFYADEVRTVEEFRTDTRLASAKEVELAKTLVQALTKPFEPDQFKNQFRERLKQLIAARTAEHQITPAEAPKPEK